MNYTQEPKNTYKQNIKAQQKLHDRVLVENTGRCRAEPLIDDNGGLHALSKWYSSHTLTHGTQSQKLYKPHKCYVCKELYNDVHHFYHQLCPECAEMNYAYRDQHCDLTGRIALVTGGRIKIGFEIVVKLLRAGATVIMTTRFAQGAIHRYSQLSDYERWKHRLRIYAIDLKHINEVELFAEYISQTYESLDIIINNAAQTLRKPDSFYQFMAQQEHQHSGTLTHEQFLLGDFSDTQLLTHLNQQRLADTSQNTDLALHTPIDEFHEPIDFSESNSWTKRLHEIDTLEFLEAQIVNATAPFLLNSKLKPLMQQSAFSQRFIINVSAMEGQFNRKNKTHHHAHTNMAKAALNMMTRTAATDYAKDSIFMNSVDTGWVTQENPFPIRQRSRIKGMVPPLDCVDGAARVLAPIFDGLTSGEPEFGKFLKDYRVADW